MHYIAERDNIRYFWIWFIIAFVFFILGIISMTNLTNNKMYNNHNLLFLTTLWVLSFILLFIITYYAFITNYHCRIMTVILFFIILLFLFLWCIQFIDSVMYANISVIIILIVAMAFIYLTPYKIKPLGIIFLFLWLFLFMYTNGILDQDKKH
jgi:hypothetical protein